MKMSIRKRANWRERNEAQSNGIISELQSQQPRLLPPSGEWIILVVGQLDPQQIPFMRWAGKSLTSEEASSDYFIISLLKICIHLQCKSFLLFNSMTFRK